PYTTLFRSGRHFVFGDLDFFAAPCGQTDIGDFIVGEAFYGFQSCCHVVHPSVVVRLIPGMPLGARNVVRKAAKQAGSSDSFPLPFGERARAARVGRGPISQARTRLRTCMRVPAPSPSPSLQEGEGGIGYSPAAARRASALSVRSQVKAVKLSD